MYMKFDSPAASFYEGFPMGNGRLGATILGGTQQETVILNESSMWSGSAENADREDAGQYLPEIRRLLAQGHVKEAETLFAAHFTCSGAGSGYGNGAQVPFGCYQVLGELQLSFFECTPFRANGLEWLTSYERELDLEKARAVVRFESQGRSFLREAFVSAPDEAFVMRLTAGKTGDISLVANLSRIENSETREIASDTILMSGSLPDGKGGTGVTYACMLKAVCEGGRVFTKQGRLYVEGADKVLLFVTAQTDMQGIVGRRNPDARIAAQKDMDKASAKSWEELSRRHHAYFLPLFGTADLQLHQAETDKTVAQLRQEAVAAGGSPAYDQLFYQFTKYLFISASRQGEIPANLQGIWAEELHTPWNGDWHFNAQQMLYWPAEVWNLSPLHTPYLDLICALKESGEKTAKAYYNAGGWVVHTFTNPWGFTSPGEDAAWGSTTGSAAWLCQHLWDHYLYTNDLNYLKEVYPVLHGAAEFYRDMLVEEPKHGWLVTSPSDSPENRYYTPEGDDCALCMGPTYDSQLVRYLFKALLDAAQLLGESDALLADIRRDMGRLAPTRLGQDGRILEWLEEYDEPLPYHRHVSHLWGLFPGDEITREQTPELAQGARKTLEKRGDASADWAIAYRACLYARLQEPEQAYTMMQNVLLHSTFQNLLCKCHHAPENIQPARLPRYEDTYFPFQMDGNMGVLAAYAEVLLQSSVTFQKGQPACTVTLLPALPKAWKTGTVRGLCTRGGITVNISWAEGTLREVQLTGAGNCTVQYAGKSCRIVLTSGIPFKFSGKEIAAWN